MRVIEASNEPVRAVAVSPDGRFLAVAAGFEVALLEWPSGEGIVRVKCPSPIGQLAFTPDGTWLVFAYAGGLFYLPTSGPGGASPLSRASFAGGVAIAPDGRTLVAALAGRRQHTALSRWELPTWRPATGFDFWSPFTRLAFSPNGEFLAGIDSDTFELRIAVTGGLNGRRFIRYLGDGFLAFSRDSQFVVFGWETELHVMETRAGAVVRRLLSPGKAFIDAAFVGSGQLLATVDGTSALKLWSAESWEVVREYDWGAGGLTCLTATVDGLAGVCGTDAGRVVVFDVDE
jgi:WD40 repeat protein